MKLKKICAMFLLIAVVATSLVYASNPESVSLSCDDAILRSADTGYW